VMKPRPPLRRLARQPGAAACLGATAALLIIAIWWVTTLATGRVVWAWRDAWLLPNGAAASATGTNWPLIYGDRVGFTVAGTWLALWLTSRWRPEPTWGDRLGRALGWLWLAVTAVLWLRCL